MKKEWFQMSFMRGITKTFVNAILFFRFCPIFCTLCISLSLETHSCPLYSVHEVHTLISLRSFLSRQQCFKIKEEDNSLFIEKRVPCIYLAIIKFKPTQ